MTRTSLLWRNVRKHKYLLLMVAPAMAHFLLFNYVPMYGILIAFQNYRMNASMTFVESVLRGDWVGLKHFIDFFNSPNFFTLLRNTLLLSVYSIAFGFPAPILFALLLNEVGHKYYRRFVQTVSFMPHFISVVAIVGIMKMFLSPVDGAISLFIAKLAGSSPIYFMGDPDWFRTLYVASGIWTNIGWGAIIYLAALAGVDRGLYESATIDGATRIRQMWHISLPAIKPTIVILLILSMSGLLTVGTEKVLLMYSPPTYPTADVLGTYLFRRGLIQGEYSFGVAVGLVNSAASFLLLVGANLIARKVTKESLW